jgi:hypothetical protein
VLHKGNIVGGRVLPSEVDEEIQDDNNQSILLPDMFRGAEVPIL